MAELTSKSSPDGIFGTKAGSKSCKSEAAQDSAGTSPLNPPLYVRYKDHVFFKNILNPKAEAIERETVGWVKEQNDEVLLLESDRALITGVKGVNGIVILKNCIIELRPLPLQFFSKWELNCSSDKVRSEFALQPKKRKTQGATTPEVEKV